MQSDMEEGKNGWEKDSEECIGKTEELVEMRTYSEKLFPNGKTLVLEIFWRR